MRTILATAVLATGGVWAVAAEWQPVPGHLMTPWAAKVDPQCPLPEYPRPQMVRAEWHSLNGLWDCAVTPRDIPPPEKFDKQILVPFPIESALSGLKQALTADEHLWYRRCFTAPALGDGRRLLLHFGAVDWEAVVWLNGKELGTHRGGYDPFTLDVTDAVRPAAENTLLVRVWDSTGANGEAHGKQRFSSIKKPGGIYYTPCSGIWQTVWLEPVPASSIAALTITPDIDAGTLRVAVAPRGAAEDLQVAAVACDGRRAVARAIGQVGQPITLAIRRAKLWSPESPFLYGLTVSLCRNGRPVDAVGSYFGMRKIALGKDAGGTTRLMLNNRFVFQAGPLDQGYWPDGLYTAPTDEALRYDIEVLRTLGFNMARKHVKIEPQRWYYWCDRLGLMVWQDMPSGGAGKKSEKGGKGVKSEKGEDAVPHSPERAGQFEAELRAMVESHLNHPSIVLWVVFNEGWGQYDTVRLTRWVKQLDPTRLVCSASGWNDRKVSDVIDRHDYPGPSCPAPEASRAAVLGEFGGLGLPLEGHTWVAKTWGYRSMADAETLTARYLELWKKVQRLRDEKGLSAAVYTQTADCETECNGLVTYDRQVVKVDAAKSYCGLVCGQFPPPAEAPPAK
ncbi:MAG: glycoside hydrolase family 2 TIM barrel-domain containing protein [Thermoguttaceae bacterium]